jgi:hypothetical protein
MWIPAFAGMTAEQDMRFQMEIVGSVKQISEKVKDKIPKCYLQDQPLYSVSHRGGVQSFPARRGISGLCRKTPYSSGQLFFVRERENLSLYSVLLKQCISFS